MTKVLVVSDQSMFSQGLKGLLGQQQGIELVDEAAYADALPNCLERCRPDVVVLGCTDPEDCPAPVVMRCLRKGIVRRIVCVNLEDSAVLVFHGERQILQDVSDLMAAITDQPPDSGPAEPTGCTPGPAQRRKESRNKTIHDGIS